MCIVLFSCVIPPVFIFVIYLVVNFVLTCIICNIYCLCQTEIVSGKDHFLMSIPLIIEFNRM